MMMKEKGLLVSKVLKIGHLKNVEADKMKAKPTHQNIIRLAPPLVITEEEIQTALRIIDEVIKELPTLKECSGGQKVTPHE
jgi:ornithine--oxo-acid transaminase